MFTHSSTQYYHPRLFRLDRHIVQPPDIANDIEHEWFLRLVGVEIDHIAQRAVCQRRAEDWYIILLSARLP